MSHPIHKISTLARPVEAKYPTNLAVLILLPVIAIGLFGWTMFNGGGFAEAALAGVYGLFTAFLTWALGREMDPDHNATGFIAMGLAVLIAGLGYPFALMSLAAVLFAVRLVNRTVGPAPKIIDIFALTGLGLGAVFVDGAWWIAGVAIIALIIDAIFEKPALPNILAAVVLGLGMGFAIFSSDTGVFSDLDTLVRGWIVTVVVISVLVIGNIWNTCEVAALMDAIAEPCHCQRVQLGMALILLAGLASLLGGQDALREHLAIWSVLAASLLGRNIKFETKTEAEA
ncbi:hypothetical protein [Hyphobacterium sp.]|uniref:hypothetical protein n=1 Tax=Hyphobacterium sp. TaxID=2004662 RepID=UPI003BA88B0C